MLLKIELWLILHFEYRDSSSSRIDVQKKALQLLKKSGLLKSNATVDDLKAKKRFVYGFR